VSGHKIRLLEEADDADELKRRSAELHRRMVEGTGDSIFPYTVGVFLRIAHERLDHLLSGRPDPSFSDDDYRALYSLGHESAHILQLLASGWFFGHVNRVSRLVMEAVRRDRAGQLDEHWTAQARGLLAAEFALLEERAYSFNVAELLETHAVCQGVRWASATDEPDELLWLAERFSAGSPLYLRLLHISAEHHGHRFAVELLPRLCLLALGMQDPRVAFAHLVARLDAEGGVAEVGGLDAAELCRWAGVDPDQLALSVRERQPETVTGNLWFETMLVSYLDAYEQFGDTSARLNAVFGFDRAAIRSPAFQPWFAVFGDGVVHPLHDPQADVNRYEGWCRISLLMLDALEYLR